MQRAAATRAFILLKGPGTDERESVPSGSNAQPFPALSPGIHRRRHRAHPTQALRAVLGPALTVIAGLLLSVHCRRGAVQWQAGEWMNVQAKGEVLRILLENFSLLLQLDSAVSWPALVFGDADRWLHRAARRSRHFCSRLGANMSIPWAAGGWRIDGMCFRSSNTADDEVTASVGQAAIQRMAVHASLD